MARLCSNCGKILEREDARFCHNCGRPVLPPSPSPQPSPITSADGTPHTPPLPEQIARQPEPQKPALRVQVVKQPEEHVPSLREQIAFQPPAQPGSQTIPPAQKITAASHYEPADDNAETLSSGSDYPSPQPASSLKDEPPASLKRLQAETKTEKPSKKPRNTVAFWPEPMTHVSITPHTPNEKATPESAQVPETLPTPPKTDPPVRELRVKVWDVGTQETPVPHAQSLIEQFPSTPPAETTSSASPDDLEEEVPVEDRPTLLMEASQSETPSSQQYLPARTEEISEDSIEDRETMHLPASAHEAPAHPDSRPQPHIVRQSTPPPALSRPAEQARPEPSPETITYPPQERPSSSPQFPAQQPAPPTAMFRPARPLSPVASRSRRLPVLLVAALLLVLLIAGTGSWIAIAQPFSVPPITQPQVSFKDPHLGLAVLYPNGWSYKVDSATSTAQFYDSSHTAQVSIAISNADNVSTRLQKQATQLGMSGAKSAAPQSFAGSSWQSLQGTVQQGGANYTCTILATTHANHLITLTQLAPQSVYNDEESTVFSHLRQSLQFL